MKLKEAEAKQEKVDMEKKTSANNFFKRALCVVCFMSPYTSVILLCLHLKNNLAEYKILKLYLLSPKCIVIIPFPSAIYLCRKEG